MRLCMNMTAEEKESNERMRDKQNKGEVVK